MENVDPIEFLKARIGEDEQASRVDADGARPELVGGTTHSHSSPERRLREVEAKRRIFERHRQYDFRYDPEDGPGDYSWTGRCDYCYKDWPCPDLRDLLSMYAEHEDYREEWKPDGANV